MFLGLAILKLQEERKLDLQQKVRDIVPEIEFTNQWEESDPVRIVHLLEHTTGWDDYHLTEQVTSQVSLKEGLDHHPHSRTCRWVPGTRMAYSPYLTGT
jgi:CubicO group peptidase (beta-lactamase class C family)